MKKINLLIALGLMASASMQAQTVITSLGFEANDTKGQSTEWALTPGKSIFGDWVNVQEVDKWNEQGQDEVHSGSYALQAVNGDGGTEQTYFRGFKIAQLNIEENTAYRVSMWVKGDEGSRFTSWISKGVENYDKSICTASGQNFGINDFRLNGEWQHVSFVSFYRDAQTMEDGIVAAKETWRGDTKLPEQFGGDGETTYKDQFNNALPDEFFFIANMFSNNVTYILDDIKIEKGVTFNQATFNDESFVVKLDFGYSTNIAKMAKETSDGIVFFDNTCVDVTIDGADANDQILFVEGHTDGFLYIFLDDETAKITPDSKVVVNFKGVPTILYDGDKRPSADYETEMAVLPFSGEVAYYDPALDVVSNEWIAPKFVSADPENESFELESATFKNIAVTYDKAVDITQASATIIKNGMQTDLTNGMTVSEDGMTVNVAVPTLADGEYNFVLDNVTNALGIQANNVELTFAVGPDNDQTISESVYSTNETFAATANGTFPVGWVSNDNGTIHQYGVFGEDTQWAGQVYNYNWGNNMKQAFNEEGGCRAMTGYSGDLNGGAIYWRCMNQPNTLGTLTFGEQVKDYVQEGGGVSDDMPEGISLYLEPSKYQITIRMCAWKNLSGTAAVDEENAPLYNFTLEDLSGKVYARFDDVKAMPNVNGNQNVAVNNVTRSQADFTVEEAGYYMLKFSCTKASAELLLGGVDLITMPSKAAYWKQQLAAAVEPAKSVLDEAEADIYDGETKTALAAVIAEAEKGGFTSPSAVEAEIAKLQEASAKMQARIKNYDDFATSVETASAAYDALEGEKYLNSDIAKNAKELIDQYATVDPSTLSDEELAEAAPKLVTAAAQVGNTKAVVDVLTWRAYKAFVAATNLGVTDAAKDQMLTISTDDTKAINTVNALSTIALYEAIAADANFVEANKSLAPVEEGAEAAELKTTVYYNAEQKSVIDGLYADMTAEDVATSGIDFSCLVDNPKFYTYAKDFGANIESNTVKGWTVEKLDGYGLHLNGTAATDANPVVNCNINAYAGGAEYKFYQVIENAPVGVYDVYLQTRTALKNNQPDPETEGIGVFNAMDEETGVWDKYIFAQVDDEDPIMVPFSAGSNWGGYPTVVKNVEVGEGQTLTIGVVEHLVSGKASSHTYEATSTWETNTTATDARLYYVAPLAGYDYAKAAEDLATAVESIEAAPAKSADNAIYNLAGQRVDASYKGIVIKNGNKYLVK